MNKPDLNPLRTYLRRTRRAGERMRYLEREIGVALGTVTRWVQKANVPDAHYWFPIMDATRRMVGGKECIKPSHWIAIVEFRHKKHKARARPRGDTKT
jgi:hypothetical protein